MASTFLGCLIPQQLTLDVTWNYYAFNTRLDSLAQQEIYAPSTGFYTKLNVWGSLGLNFEYDGGPIFLYKLWILEGSTSFREGSVLSPGQ